MTRRMFAWDGDIQVGIFEETAGGATFCYAAGYDGPPISLSMPLSGPWADDAPGRFLRSRLPEGTGSIAAMRMAFDAPSTSPFDLLPYTDAVGGLSFTSRDEKPAVTDLPAEPCSPRALEAHIVGLSSRQGESWWPENRPRVRFSLAGAQGKFSMARYGGRWYWPNGSMPSTHIFKPDSPRFRRSGIIEDASMSMAGHMGAEVADHRIETVGSTSCYVTERFDRDKSSWPAKRLRTEELFYSLGLDEVDKYGMEVREVVGLMRRAGLSDEVAYDWISQVMVCMSLGDCDAHMRNYSVHLDENVRMTPLYDVVSTMYWPELDDGFAVMVNESCMACGEFRPSDWEAEAKACGLDADRLSHDAVETARAALRSLDAVLPRLPEECRDRFAYCICSANRNMLGIVDLDPPDCPDLGRPHQHRMYARVGEVSR